ncbi:hypothetical protein SGODD07_02150 [Streptococcus gordonii]|uniref:Uncharacterized protein n=1 Tax=Streptococcus gordonii TaxID=1302 RepID=A0A139MWM2_STRGN|nr:hypothetical protein SGODD07_02150 [Streptococcus gordonii]
MLGVDSEVVGLVYNKTSWKEDTNDREFWKPISDFFQDNLLKP